MVGAAQTCGASGVREALRAGKLLDGLQSTALLPAAMLVRRRTLSAPYVLTMWRSSVGRLRPNFCCWIITNLAARDRGGGAGEERQGATTHQAEQHAKLRAAD